MNARTPYWPLFRNELGFDHCPKITWALAFSLNLALWFGASSFPLVILFKVSEGDLGTFFAAFGDLTGFVMIWWLAMTGWFFAFALFPGISNPVQSIRAFEFMFTRAIDRRRLFRARAVLIYLLLLGPLLLNLLVSTGSRETTVGSDAFDPDGTAIRRAQYQQTFPDSRLNEEKSQEQPAPIVIPHGAVALTAWVFWLGTFGLLFMQGYCTVVVNHIKHNPWLAGLAVGVPVMAAMFFAPWIPRHHPHFYEESFLFFARNGGPLLLGLLVLIPGVQLFSEHRFRKLEIL